MRRFADVQMGYSSSLADQPLSAYRLILSFLTHQVLGVGIFFVDTERLDQFVAVAGHEVERVDHGVEFHFPVIGIHQHHGFAVQPLAFLAVVDYEVDLVAKHFGLTNDMYVFRIEVFEGDAVDRLGVSRCRQEQGDSGSE